MYITRCYKNTGVSCLHLEQANVCVGLKEKKPLFYKYQLFSLIVIDVDACVFEVTCLLEHEAHSAVTSGRVFACNCSVYVFLCMFYVVQSRLYFNMIIV